MRGDVALLRELLVTDDRVRTLSDDEWHDILGLVIYSGQGAELAQLTQLRPPPEDKRDTLLCHAAAAGSVDAARHLIAHGASVNGELEVHGVPHRPLDFAVSVESLALARMLIEHGAEVNAPRGGEGTPLLTAVARGNLELVVLLLEAGADPNLPANELHVFPLILAALRGDLLVARTLVEHGASAQVSSERPSGGRLSLMQAAEAGGNEELAVFLRDARNRADAESIRAFFVGGRDPADGRLRIVGAGRDLAEGHRMALTDVAVMLPDELLDEHVLISDIGEILGRRTTRPLPARTPIRRDDVQEDIIANAHALPHLDRPRARCR